jgi:hypothetical protein
VRAGGGGGARPRGGRAVAGLEAWRGAEAGEAEVSRGVRSRKEESGEGRERR